MQTKTAVGSQPHAGTPAPQPAAPPVYRPEQRRAVQPKPAAAARKTAAAPPVYRPEQKKTVQPRMATAAPQRTTPKAATLQTRKAVGAAPARPHAAPAAPPAAARQQSVAPPRVERPNAFAKSGGPRPPVCQPKAARVAPAPRPVAGRSAGVVQPYIPVKYREWKEAHPSKGLADYLALVENERRYATDYAEDDGPKKYKTNLDAEALYFDQQLARYHNKPKKQVIRALDQLVDRINLVLNETHSKGYINDFTKGALLNAEGTRRLPVNDWEQGRDEGVFRTFGELVAHRTKTLAVSGPDGNPGVPVVPYSQAKRYLPWALCSLILKIYDSWKRGDPFDERTATERGDRLAAVVRPPSLAVARAGTMRSWHMDGHGLLPENPALSVTPTNVQNYTDYVTRHSHTPNNVGHAVAPSGYIEYTGAGHGTDRTFRVMLDYRRGKIFICYHYQLWSIDGDGDPHTHGQNPAHNQDKNNPWINLDMNA